jgi:hypothetical protein
LDQPWLAARSSLEQGHASTTRHGFSPWYYEEEEEASGGSHWVWHKAAEALTWAHDGAGGGSRSCVMGAAFRQREEKWEVGFREVVSGEADGALYSPRAALGR